MTIWPFIRTIAAPLVTSILVAASAGCGSPVTDPCASHAPTFSAVDTCIIKTSCSISSSCHNAAGHQGSLDLVTDPYAAIVGVAPVNTQAIAKGWKRVVPSDPSTSYFYQKLILPSPTEPTNAGPNGPNMGLGSRMPNTGQNLDPAEIDQIKAWIAMGAPKN
jgi:hypothetical protein